MNKFCCFQPFLLTMCASVVLTSSAVSAYTLDTKISSDEELYLTTNIFQIYNGRCLDVQWGGTESRTPIQAWDCNRTEAQQWRVLQLDGDFTSKGWFSLKNVGSGKCLDVQWGNFSIRNPLWLWDCNDTDAQKFNLLGTFENSGAFDQIAAGGDFKRDLCLDSDDSNKVALWYCRSPRGALDNALYWHMIPLSSASRSFTRTSVEDNPDSSVDDPIQVKESVPSAAVPEPSSVLSVLLIGIMLLHQRCKKKAVRLTR